MALAKVIARNPKLLTEWAWTVKTGTPPRAFNDYPLPLLHALMFDGDFIRRELAIVARETARAEYQNRRNRLSGPPRLGKRSPTGGGWDTPRYTGDPVADEWERAIAAGQMPNLER